MQQINSDHEKIRVCDPVLSILVVDVAQRDCITECRVRVESTDRGQ